MGPLATGTSSKTRSAASPSWSRERASSTAERSGSTAWARPRGKVLPGADPLRSDDARSAGPVHDREVFGPVATLLPYASSAVEAAEVMARAAARW